MVTLKMPLKSTLPPPRQLKLGREYPTANKKIIDFGVAKVCQKHHLFYLGQECPVCQKERLRNKSLMELALSTHRCPRCGFELKGWIITSTPEGEGEHDK
ncbi:MAG: hypothetical protein ABIH63_04370 [archaeon]